MYHMEFFLEHCPTGARPDDYDGCLTVSTKRSRTVKKHEVKIMSGLGSSWVSDIQCREEYSEEAFHMVALSLHASPSTRIQDLQPKHSHTHARLGFADLFNLLQAFLRSLNEKHYFMLYCFSLRYFIKNIIPIHALFKAKKLIWHSEIRLARIHSALLGSRTYIIYWEALQLRSYRFSIGTDATRMMSVKCWVGLSLSSSVTPASAFLQEVGGREGAKTQHLS